MTLRELILSISVATIALVSCDLNEDMVSAGTKELIFGSSQGLETYSLSLYQQLPSLSSLAGPEGTATDYGVCKSIDTFYTEGYSAETSTSWGWGNLRAVNYLIDGIHSEVCTVPQDEKDHYEGLARWFRAWFYYSKLTTYGPVPWFDHCLSNDELDEMYKNRV